MELVTHLGKEGFHHLPLALPLPWMPPVVCLIDFEWYFEFYLEQVEKLHLEWT